ncbi:MAG: hypothetical protein JWM27_3426 [Gemmatimonadetes bacterium]|nr:hypothetical protein [Gemmatimonadota bacterium]
MTAHWLYTIPLWLLAILLVGGSAAVAMGGVLLARRLGWTVSADDNAGAGFLHAFLGVVYAVALGLIVVTVQADYGDVDEAVVREASSVGDLYRVADGLAEPMRSQLRGEIRDYVDLVVRDEWPAVARGGSSERTAQAMDGIARHVIRFHPPAGHDVDLYPQLLTTVQTVLDARRERLIQGVDGISAVTWMVIVLGGLITLGFACTFHMDSRRAQLALTGLMGTSFALMIFLIIAMDHPLWGDLSIGPDAFRSLQTSFTRMAGEDARHARGAPGHGVGIVLQ